LSEVLARIRNGPVLSRASAPGWSGRALALALAERAKTLPARAYFAAVLSAVLVGIWVNALMLQPERRPGPRFAPAPRRPSSAISAPSAVPAPRAASVKPTAASAPAVPPARPWERPPGAPDPITSLLRGEAQGAPGRLVLTAQTALAKLGYAVQPDGNEGSATQEALRDFERAHGLPIGTEITPQLVKQLLKATRSGER
jgi:Putative peptidoglycan binding domain